MADGLTEWWDDETVAALPSYLEEGRRTPPVRVGPVAPDDEEVERRTAPWAWLAGPPAPGDWGPPTMIMSRVIEVAPADALAAFWEWWSAQSAPAVVELGSSRLVLRAADTIGGPFCLCRLHGAIRFHRATPSLRVEFDLAAWSASRTQLDLRPEAGWPCRRRRRQYFRVSPTLVDWLAGELLGSGPGSDHGRPGQRHAA